MLISAALTFEEDCEWCRNKIPTLELIEIYADFEEVKICVDCHRFMFINPFIPNVAPVA